MNIQEAKDEIKRTLRIYTEKKADGSRRIPVDKQRPILLIGPPGIGKTAIMKQIASEENTGLVSYTMTHHTRQSAIGLPYIKERSFRGVTSSITEYTMSEIVSSIYIYMEETGHDSGILFLDEINCVSETLAPVMLQLLQNKTFGNHPLPEGWVIVAAGNPPEYNKSVREMDMVTLDRVKYMYVEASLPIWQRYAAGNLVHPAIRSYLALYPDHFYQIEQDARGRHFVTARGWEDLSFMLTAYEEKSEPVTENFFLQYLQHDSIAHSFALFYRYFAQAAGAMASAGDGPSAALINNEALKTASPVEILALTSQMFDQIRSRAASWTRDEEQLMRVSSESKLFGSSITEDQIRARWKALETKRSQNLLTPEEEFLQRDVLRDLEHMICMPPQERDTCLRNGQATLLAAGREITETIDRIYDLLAKLPQGDAALMFFTNDLASDSDCCRVLTAVTSIQFPIYATRLLEI